MQFHNCFINDMKARLCSNLSIFSSYLWLSIHEGHNRVSYSQWLCGHAETLQQIQGKNGFPLNEPYNNSNYFDETVSYHNVNDNGGINLRH